MKLKMDFISSGKLNGKAENKRVDYILGKVKDGSILVMDGVMKPEEEMNLIKETMRRVDDGFPGIEVCSLKKELKGLKLVFDRLSDGKERLWNWISRKEESELKTGITLIGPAKLIKKIKKNPDSFSVLAET
jgi:hypothetical protein